MACCNIRNLCASSFGLCCFHLHTDNLQQASRLTLNTRQSVNRRQLGPYWIGNLGNGVQSSDEMELYARTTFATSAPPSPVCVQPPTPDTEFSPLSPMTDARFALQQARRGPSRSYTQSPSLSPPPGAVGRRSRGSLSSIAVLARSSEWVSAEWPLYLRKRC